MKPEVQQLRWVLHKRGLWNFSVFLRFSEVWPSCYGFREFRRVATAAVYLTILVRRRLSQISPWNYSCRKFRRSATAVGTSMYFYGLLVANFAVLLRLCGIFSVLLRLSGILPVARAVRNFINTAMNGPRKSKPLFCRKCAPVATAAMCCTNSMQWS